MATKNVRLTEEDNAMIAKAQKKLEKSGMVRPKAADAVRAALKEYVGK